MRGRSLLIILAVTVLLIFPVGGAVGLDVEDLAISPASKIDQKQYDPIVQSNPGSASQNPTICRSAPYCDTIDLVIAVPETFTDNWMVRMTITWEDIAESDIDVFFYDPSQARLTASETGTQPEVMTARNLDPGRHFITILNWVGVHEYYVVKAEFIPLPKAAGSGRIFTPPPTDEPVPPGAVTSAPPSRSGGLAPFTGGGIEGGGALQPLAPVEVDLGEERPAAVGFTPEGDGDVPSQIEWEGARLATGLGSLAAIMCLAYVLLFMPRRLFSRRPSKPTPGS